jgi:outer membrane immunogenic protein
MDFRSGVRFLGGALLGALMLARPACAAAGQEPAPVWSGFYIGAHGGYGWGGASYTFDTFVGPEDFSHSFGNWFVGGHLGSQHQWGRLVAGLEASYSGLHFSDTVESTLLPGRFRQIDIDALVTISARLGYAFDHSLAYVKGGFAAANVDTLVYINPAGPVSATSGWEHGWTIGGGLEFMCGRRLILGVEYNYVQLGLGGRSGLLPDLKPFTYRGFDDGLHSVLVRLSYKFGQDPAPVPLK